MNSMMMCLVLLGPMLQSCFLPHQPRAGPWFHHTSPESQCQGLASSERYSSKPGPISRAYLNDHLSWIGNGCLEHGAESNSESVFRLEGTRQGRIV